MITRQSTLADPGVPWSEFSTTCCLEHAGACCKFYLSINPPTHAAFPLSQSRRSLQHHYRGPALAVPPTLLTSSPAWHSQNS